MSPFFLQTHSWSSDHVRYRSLDHHLVTWSLMVNIRNNQLPELVNTCCWTDINRFFTYPKGKNANQSIVQFIFFPKWAHWCLHHVLFSFYNIKRKDTSTQGKNAKMSSLKNALFTEQRSAQNITAVMKNGFLRSITIKSY